jgi:hypothetical protein
MFAAFNSVGDKIMTASLDETAKIWDVGSGKCLQVLRGHKEGLNYAQINEAGDKIVITSVDSSVMVWDLRTLLKVERFLKSELTHKQALLLLGIYETGICRALVREHGVRAFKDAASVPQKVQMKFDLNKHPHLQEAFETLPREIQDIVRPSVIKRVPNNAQDDN